MLEYFAVAFALFLVLEGLMPFLAPNLWRITVLEMAKKSDNTLRIFGLASMLIGVFILAILK